MRVPIILLLAVSSACVSWAQEKSCTATAGVQAVDLASFPDKASEKFALRVWGTTLRDPQMLGAQDALAFDYASPLWVPVTDIPPEAFVAIEKKRSIPVLSDAFVALAKNRSISVLSAEPRGGPLRIVFVVENGRRVTPAQRQVEAAALQAILSVSRRKDSFAFFSTAAPRLAVPLGSSRKAIGLAFERLKEPGKKGPKDDEVSSALLEAAESFGRPREGDAIILLARTVAGRRRLEIRTALTSRGIRLFSFALDAMVEAGWSGTLINPLATLSEETGGGWEEAGPPPHKDRATDTELQTARRYARKLYAMATTYYVLRLEHTGPHVVIGLSPHTLDQMPWGRVVYPMTLPVCP